MKAEQANEKFYRLSRAAFRKTIRTWKETVHIVRLIRLLIRTLDATFSDTAKRRVLPRD